MNICVCVCVRVFGWGGCEGGKDGFCCGGTQSGSTGQTPAQGVTIQDGAGRPVDPSHHRLITSRGRGPRAVGSRGPRVTLVQRRSCVPIPGATAGLSPGGSWMAALPGCRHLGPQPGSCVASACLFLTPPGPSPHRMPPHRSKHPGPWLVTRGAGSSLAMPLPAGGPQAPPSGNPLGTQCLFWSFSQVASDEP